MAQYITKIRTEQGDLQIDYNALANKPASLPANGGNSDTVDGKHANEFASATEFEETKTNLSKSLDDTKINLNNVITKLDNVSTEELTHITGVTGNIQVQLDNKQKRHTTIKVELPVTGWAKNKQTVSVSSINENNTIIVCSAPENFEAYGSDGVYCSKQSNGKLTFSCSSVPEVDLIVNIMILD